MSDVVLSTSAWLSWSAAEKACFEYICNAVGYKPGVNAFLGDTIPKNLINVFVFNISGGGSQSQNSQCPRPAKFYKADADLFGRFEKRTNALEFAGRLLDNLPAYGDPAKRTGLSGGENIILEPNVQRFEMTTFPILRSIIVEVEKVGREGKVMKAEQTWALLFNFWVAFNNQNISDSN